MNTKNTSTLLQKSFFVWLGAFVCCFLWGSAFPSIKIGYRLFQISPSDTATQILFAGLRFTIAGLICILLGSMQSHTLLRPTKTSIVPILKLSIMQTVAQYLFFYIGLAHTTGVKSSIVSSMTVFLSILIASLCYHTENLSSKKIIGCCIGFIGVVLINITGSSFDTNFSFYGEGFIFLSSVSSAFSSIYLKKYSQKENPVALSGNQFVFGGLIMILSGFIMGGHIDHFSIPAIFTLLYLALVSSVAYSLWGILLKYNPVSRVAIFGFMTPVFGVILSAIFLNESKQAFCFINLISLILVCLGIYIVNNQEEPEGQTL